MNRTSMDPAQYPDTIKRAHRQAQGPSLFDVVHEPIPEVPAPEPDPSIEEQFQTFHAANPHVYAEITARALRLLAAGATRVGMKMIVESMRYDWSVRTAGDPYQLNNNFPSRYARLLLADHPELDGVIETRALRTE